MSYQYGMLIRADMPDIKLTKQEKRDIWLNEEVERAAEQIYNLCTLDPLYNNQDDPAGYDINVIKPLYENEAWRKKMAVKYIHARNKTGDYAFNQTNLMYQILDEAFVEAENTTKS